MNKVQQVRKLIDSGFLFFEIPDDEQDLLRELRDNYIKWHNSELVSFFYNKDDTDKKDNKKNEMKIVLSKNDLKLLDGDRYAFEDYKFFSEITKDGWLLNDARIEVTGDWNMLTTILERIWFDYYGDRIKIDMTEESKKILEQINNDYYGDSNFPRLAFESDNGLRFDIYGRIMTKGMKLLNHRDGMSSGKRLCTILLYTNDDWEKNMGGELVVSRKTLSPKIGNAAILDFTGNKDVTHGVREITDMYWKRKSFTIFVDKK